MFLAKVVTFLVAFVIVAGFIIANAGKSVGQDKGTIVVTNLNDRFDQMHAVISSAVLEEDEIKEEEKNRKKKQKQDAKEKKEALKAKKDKGQKDDSGSGEDASRKKRIFVLDFDGDIKASATDELREAITAVLSLAKPQDEVVLRLESPGGVVHGYGLAASQLDRVRQKEIPLTVCVDKVAASGGYMMACVADKILAAPFAIVGSIGVLAQVPNFNKILKKHDVDYDIFTAGEYKRTLTMLGENTEKGRQKFKDDLEDTHVLFKDFIREHRSAVDIEDVATGEIWFGSRALDKSLIDGISTSDEYLTSQHPETDIVSVEYEYKKTIQEKLGVAVSSALEATFLKVWAKLTTKHLV